MTKYFGSGVTVSIGGTVVGQLESFTPPEDDRDVVDMTGLDDSFPDVRLAPIPNFTEFPLNLYFDRSDSDQATIDGYQGDDTSRSMVVTFPWATNNTYTQSIKVKNGQFGEIVKKEGIKKTYICVTTSAGAWSTV